MKNAEGREAMIAPDKYENTMRAFQALIARALTMTNESAPHAAIAGILDAAEYLPFLISRPLDETDRVRGCLVDVARRYNCPQLLDIFDGRSR